MIDGRTFRVEYESLENMCFFYGMYGHQEATYQDLAEPTSNDKAPNHPYHHTGSWIVVSHR
ncbi:hypothetical protein LINPERPRIM_LOCUS31629 [Linum perenne]